MRKHVDALLLLVIAGLVGPYFPDARTFVQARVNPSAWYYIGKTSGGRFINEPFQHPLWSGGSAPEATLLRLGNSTMVTMGGGLYIGRAAAGRDQPIRTNLSGDVCLKVEAVERRFAAGDRSRYIGAKAVRISY